ncbi:MAG TPA: hypothetical protein VFJ51_05875 [Nitrososphaeraceae archaeon]|nr:hypothetical protein [Nitrososphaeraceae archaeon]
MVKRGHVAYGSGFRQRYAFLAGRFRIIDRSKIRQIFVDKTLKIDGLEYWLWIAYEPNLDGCLMMMHLPRKRTILVCYQFFKQLKDRYGISLFLQIVPIGTIIQPVDGGEDYLIKCIVLN